jgi:hypothetical protein
VAHRSYRVKRAQTPHHAVNVNRRTTQIRYFYSGSHSTAVMPLAGAERLEDNFFTSISSSKPAPRSLPRMETDVVKAQSSLDGRDREE